MPMLRQQEAMCETDRNGYKKFLHFSSVCSVVTYWVEWLGSLTTQLSYKANLVGFGI